MATDTLILFETKAAVFYHMTGLLAPGKDYPALGDPFQGDDRTRRAAWEDWNKQYGRAVELTLLVCKDYQDY